MTWSVGHEYQGLALNRYVQEAKKGALERTYVSDIKSVICILSSSGKLTQIGENRGFPRQI